LPDFIHPQLGNVFLSQEEITNLPIQKREVGLLFQDFAIFPHLSVFDNIAYALRNISINKSRRLEIIRKIAAELEVSHLLQRNTITLSGGEQQRVALASTLGSQTGSFAA
jgi:ABC-type Fe3+/spermidine/putrescine transport system ATPase subunit